MRIPNQKIILIDFFDTCVFRDVSEREIKRIWSNRLSDEINHVISSDVIYDLRLMTERSISEDGKDSYYSFDDLINGLYDRIIKNFPDVSVDKQWFLDVSKKNEEKIEIEHQFINNDVIDMLFKAKENKHIIILVSDFYLGKESFDIFLDNLGLNDMFDSIYISCDYSLSKATGRLYQVVLNDLKQQYNNIKNNTIMIGDKKISDYKNSLENGVSFSIQYKHKNKINNDIDKFYKCLFFKDRLFSNYAFSLYLFCDRLFDYCLTNNVSVVYFFSREGQFLKKIFDEYQINKTDLITTKYLYVSRNATFLPSLKEIEKEDFNRLFNQYSSNVSIKTFLYDLQFTENEINKICNSKSILNNNVSDTNALNSIISSTVFKSLYEEKRIKANQRFKCYLKSKGIVAGENIVVVDVGWKGTIQDNIWHCFNGELGLTGLYLGYARRGELYTNNIKKGLLFDYINYKECGIISSDIFAFNSFLYEMFLVADHGRTNGYSITNDPIIVDDEDIIMYKLFSETVQTKILNKITQIGKKKGNSLLDRKEVLLFELLHGEMFKKMSIKDVLYLDKMISLHKDGFGNKKSGSASGGFIKRLIKLKFRPYIRMKGYYNSKNGIAKW